MGADVARDGVDWTRGTAVVCWVVGGTASSDDVLVLFASRCSVDRETISDDAGWVTGAESVTTTVFVEGFLNDAMTTRENAKTANTIFAFVGHLFRFDIIYSHATPS